MVYKLYLNKPVSKYEPSMWLDAREDILYMLNKIRIFFFNFFFNLFFLLFIFGTERDRA